MPVTPRALRKDKLMSYHERNSNVLGGADPVAHVAFDLVLYRWLRMGEDVLVTECWRSKEDQEKEFAEGDSNAHWPYSFHNHGLAIDVVPVLFGQTAVTYGAAARYAALAEEAKKVPGIEWLFELMGYDKPHFQCSQGKPIQHFVKGGRLDAAPIIFAARSYYVPLIERLQGVLANKNLSARRRAGLQGHLTLAMDNLARVTSIAAGSPSTPA